MLSVTPIISSKFITSSAIEKITIAPRNLKPRNLILGASSSFSRKFPPTKITRYTVSGRVAHGTKPGPRPYLSTEEETEFGTFLKNCASVGYGKTRKDVLLIAESVAKEKDVLKKECITSGWWNKFLKRQGDLSTISKYLVCPANTTPSGIGRKSLPRARLLTSAESLAMFEEKEKKHQDEKEQKEKRKKEREEKKKQREVDMKRKAEERAKKAEERVKKAEVKAQKAAEQKEKKQGVKRKCRGTKLGSISLKEEQSQ